jgi:ATP-dependent Lhr-like helicase
MSEQHPAPFSLVEHWFAERGWTPFPFQREVWRAYLAGESGLIHASTGTGKTYAAWMGPIIEWLDENKHQASGIRHQASSVSPSLRVLWVTPLRALAADTEAALRAPLENLGLPWTLETRTGDTSSSIKARQRKRLPTALITTPESLSLMLTWPNAAALFADLRAVIVDEWHELMGTKRGVQTELALARLRHWRPALRTWSLSATLGNLDVALNALVGQSAVCSPQSAVSRQPPAVGQLPTTGNWQLATGNWQLIQGHVPKTIQIDAIIPEQIERFPWAGHLGLRLLPQVLDAVEQSESTLIFTNTRSQTEIWYQAILDARPDWAGKIALHHGSLGGDVRAWVEAALHDGRLRCVVCTSSLDLGVDFTPVDRVLQIGSPKGVARLLQRAGRSGHQPGRASRVTCVPTNAFELVEVAAVRQAVTAGQIEARPPVECPLDVLVQHVVTIALGGGFVASELLAEVRTTYAYRNLSAAEWAWVLDFATRGGPALQNYPEYNRVVVQDGRYVVADEAIAKRHRMSVGTITSDAAMRVQFLRGDTLGTIEESFVARLKPGDTFVFAGRVLEFVRVRDMVAWVRLSSSRQGVVPRWAGGRLPLSNELGRAVRAKLDEARRGVFHDPEMQAVRPILELQARWSRIPASDELLIERVKTREGYHLFFYPFEGRLVHEGLAALVAYRLAQRQPITFTLAVNDYGFELLSPDLAPLEQALADERPKTKDECYSGEDVSSPLVLCPSPRLFSTEHLLDDITASLNATEMARRQFRDIARVSGLIIQGYPGEKSTNQVQASSGLIYDVFARYDPENLLLQQASREVLERQLERSRLMNALERIAAGRVVVVEARRPTPLAFPLLVDRMRDAVSSEKLADRVRRMQERLERAADR